MIHTHASLDALFRQTKLGLGFACALLLAACPSGSDNGNNGGPSGNTGATGNTGGTGFVAACDLDKLDGVLGAPGALGATTVGATCEKDFDCWLGQVCTDGKCAAESTDEKLFGEAQIAEDGDYVVTVYAPANAAADQFTDQVEPVFEFGTVTRSPPSGKLYRLPGRALAVDGAAAAAVAARGQVEEWFRAKERDALLLGPQEGALGDSPIRQAACAAAEFSYKGTCYAVGAELPAFQYSFRSLAITPVLKKVEGSTAILVDKDDTIAQADIDRVATAFETVGAKRDLAIFNKGAAHTGALDTDGNGKVAIILSTKVPSTTSKIVGVFDVSDVLATGTSFGMAQANGNEADVMWAIPPGAPFTDLAGAPTTVSFELVIGTLAHEYQHMINFARAKSQSPVKTETLWLNEALSHLAEDLTGYGASNLPAVAEYLGKWNTAGISVSLAGSGNNFDSVAMRGVSYLYLRYLFEKAGGYELGANGSITDKGGISFVEKLLSPTTNGLASLASAGGQTAKRFALFFPALVVASDSSFDAAVRGDCRFSFAATTTDPVTGQKNGVQLSDATRVNAYGDSGTLVGFDTTLCAKDQVDGGSSPDCSLYATGAVSFLWEGAAASDVVRVRGPSGVNLRLVAVKVK